MIFLAKIILIAALISCVIIIAIFVRLMLEDSEATEIDTDESEEPESIISRNESNQK
jgi:hypothetical protein